MHMLHDPGRARGFGDDIRQDLRIDAERLADPESLRDCDEGRARDPVVAQFGGLTCADMDDVRTHRCEHRPRRVEIAGITATTIANVPAAVPPIPPETGA